MRLLTLYLGFSALAAACSNDSQNGAVTTAGGAGVGGTSGVSANGASGVSGKSGAAVGVAGAGGSDAPGNTSGGGGAPQHDDAGAGGSRDPAGDAGATNDGGGGHSRAGEGGGGFSGSAGGGAGTGGGAGNCNVVTADKRIFVSSAVYIGTLGGLSGADSKCQTLASAAGLCGTYKAWLSDGTADAAARLTHATGNYVLVNGQVVASGWAGLTSGTVQHAIDLTETNGLAPAGTVTCAGSPIVPVWTGASVSGVAVPNGSCNNWATASTGPGAAFGSAIATNAAWSGMCQTTTVCASTAALYCIEQ